MNPIRFPEYLILLADKIREFEDARNIEQCERLTKLLMEVCEEYLVKLQKAKEETSDDEQK